MSKKINNLLLALGWPSSELKSKGSIQWQGKIDFQKVDLSKASSLKDFPLPPTASLSVTPKSIRATVLNINPSSGLEPHLLIEWDTSSPSPKLKKYTLAGMDMMQSENPDEKSVENFTSLVALINTPKPKIDIYGKRDKSNKSEINTSQSFKSGV